MISEASNKKQGDKKSKKKKKRTTKTFCFHNHSSFLQKMEYRSITGES